MTADVIDAVLEVLEAYDQWPDDAAPDAYHFGAVPPLSHPCELGVMAGPQRPRDMPVVSDTEEDFEIQLSLAIDPSDLAASIRRALALRDEVRKIVWNATNWGVDAVTQTSLGDTNIGIGIDTRTNGWVIAVDVRFTVTYQDDF